jgi:hypothetical protein
MSPLIGNYVVPLPPDFLFLLMDQGGLYNLVVGPLTLDRLDGGSFVDFTERFDLRIDGIESSPKLQMRLRGTSEAIKQAAGYLYTRQKVTSTGIPERS